jgi:hypothetical protein
MKRTVTKAEKASLCALVLAVERVIGRAVDVMERGQIVPTDVVEAIEATERPAEEVKSFVRSLDGV